MLQIPPKTKKMQRGVPSLSKHVCMHAYMRGKGGGGGGGGVSLSHTPNRLLQVAGGGLGRKGRKEGEEGREGREGKKGREKEGEE